MLAASTTVDAPADFENLIPPTRDKVIVPAADIIRLILAHLQENGFHAAVETLVRESGIGLAGCSTIPWYDWAVSAQWGKILSQIALLDSRKIKVLAEVYEMAILEAAEQGDVDVAYAFFRLAQQELQESFVESTTDSGSTEKISRARLLEQRLAYLQAHKKLPPDYYHNTSREDRRHDLGVWLQENIPWQPPKRLETLIQQAVQWQAYTGTFPRVKEVIDESNDADTDNMPKRKRRKCFDIVTGLATVEQVTVSHDTVDIDPTILTITPRDLVQDTYSTIKFGKGVVCEAAVFTPDGNAIISGTSDGWIEVWDGQHDYKKLCPFPYQLTDDLMSHSDSSITALNVSNDGTLLASASKDGVVKIWRLDTGKCLRQWSQAHSVSDMAMSADGSHLLVANVQNGNVREFGLRSSRLLQEIIGPSNTYVTTCHYYDATKSDSAAGTQVITASSDGAVRIFDRISSQLLHVFQPKSLGPVSSVTVTGSKLAAEASILSSLAALPDVNCPSIHTVIPLHTPSDSVIVVPRGPFAFLIRLDGEVLRTFASTSQYFAGPAVFVAATVSACNHILYLACNNGMCCVYDMSNGTMIKDMPLLSDKDETIEISALLYHPNKRILGSYSNSKSQKKGKLTLWK